MKNFAFAVLVVGLFTFAFTLGLGIGEVNGRFVDAVYGYTYGIWIPAAVLALAMPALAYAVYADRRAKAEKFRIWCTTGLGFASDEKVRNAFLDAIVLALDTEVINREDVRYIFHDASPSDVGRRKLRVELSDRIQDRLKSGAWNLAKADTNRRRVIEGFGYYRDTGYSH